MKKSVCLILLFLVGCSSSRPTPINATETTTSIPKVTSTITQIPSPTSTPQPHPTSINLGPDEFPSNINPLTGRAVADLSMLQFPAVLVSISNSPASARPQAGPGFAPWVFELFIGEGVTRFMNVFYGDLPRAMPNVTGGCEVRDEIIHPNGDWIGNRVWLDENENGIQDDWEMGVGGVCVRLLNGISRDVLQETSTDSNGYYAFENPKNDVIVQFEISPPYQFTQANIGYEDDDSDADETTGETQATRTDSTTSFIDAGLILQ